MFSYRTPPKFPIELRCTVSVVSRIEAGWSWVWILAVAWDFSLLQGVQTSYGAHPVFFSIPKLKQVRYEFNHWSPSIWTEASRCAYKRNIILNSVRQHNHFITQGNCIGFMFWLLISHLHAYFVDWVTRCYAHFGIPLCLHSWKYIKIKPLYQRCDMQIVFTPVGYIKLDYLSRKMWYTNCVIKFYVF